MIPIRLNGPAASGIWLTAMAAGVVAGLFRPVSEATGGEPAGMPPMAVAGVQQATPGAAVVADAACRVVGGPLSRLAGADDTAVVTAALQNPGAAPATVDAIELGWVGSEVLVDVEVGGVHVPIKSGGSPLLIPLGAGGPIVIDGGQRAELRLVFYQPRPDPEWRPGPVIVVLREGCEVALRWPEASGCPVAATGPTLPVEQPARVWFELSNPGPAPVDLAMLELTWPAANGALVGLQVDAGAVHALDPPFQRSPAALDVARVAGPVVVPASGSLVLAFDFEQPAAAADYALRATTKAGCVVTASSWLAFPSCGTEVQSFDSHGSMALVRVGNRSGISQTLSTLDVFWVPALNGALASVAIDGHVVWDQGSDVSPTTIADLSRTTILRPGQVAEVRLEFKAPAPLPALDGTADDDPAPVASDGIAGDFTFVAGFQGGCTATYSTLRGGAFGCRPWAVEQLTQVKGAPANEVSAAITNTGGGAALRSLTLTWPHRNGALTGAFLGATPLLTQPRLPSAEPLVLTFDPASAAVLPRSASQRLRLTFAQPAAAGGYAAVLGFDDLSGAPCSELRVTSPAIEPECGKVGFGAAMAFKGRHVELEIHNDSPDPLRISDLRLDWPEQNGMTLVRLTSISLADAFSDWLIWTAPDAAPLRPPVTLRPDPSLRPAVVEAGAHVVLRLTFDPQPRDTPEFRESFKLTAGFAEGCRAAYPLDGARIASRTIDFVGVVRDLPRRAGGDTLFGCCWQVLDRQNRTRLVEVDAYTRLLPASVKPKRGDIVEISALELLDRKTFYAKQITVRTRLPEETIVGLVGAMQPAEPSPSAPLRSLTVAGEAVVVTDQTVIDDARRVTPGARVMVRGTRDVNQQLVASEVAVLDPVTNAAVSIRGAVRDVVDDAAPGLQAVWTVDHYAVEIPVGAVIEGLPPSGRPGLGWEARVDGEQVGADVIRAASVKLVPAPRLIEAEGVLVALPSGGGVRGDWSVRPLDGPVDGSADRVFTVESSAVVDTRAAPVALGMRVHVVARDKGEETPTAVSVRLDWP